MGGIRDWLLIIGRGGGGGATEWENSGPKLVVPPPSRQGKTFCPPPLFKGWELFCKLYRPSHMLR